MPFCKNCGAQLEETVKFCPSCGTAQTASDTSANSAAPPPPLDVNATVKASGVLNVGSLVWSIINLVFCCMPLAIASLIMTILAKDAPSAAEEAKKLKTAKICNLIATIGGAVISILYIVLIVIGMLMGK